MSKTVSKATHGITQTVFDFGRLMRQRMIACDTGHIPMSQLHVLVFIQEKPGITMKEIANALRVTSPSATALVDRLVKLGYVSRQSDDTNRRLVRLKLTDTGTDMLRQKSEERRKVFAEIFGVLSEDEMTTLSTILRKLLDRCSAK